MKINDFAMITQEIFERAVPAFAAPDSFTFDRLSGFLESAKAEVDTLCGDFIPADDPSRLRLVCLAAAVLAVPHLDLALTPTGFGVVSNTHTVPASPVRVENLLKSLKFVQSSTEDNIIMGRLTHTAWSNTPQASQIISLLLFCPTVCRTYGVPCQSRDDFTTLRPKLTAADLRISQTISTELLEEVLEDIRTGQSKPPIFATLAHKLRTAAALLVHPEGRTEEDINRTLQDAKGFVQRHSSDFLAFTNSSAAAADKINAARTPQEYETAFFFG